MSIPPPSSKDKVAVYGAAQITSSYISPGASENVKLLNSSSQQVSISSSQTNFQEDHHYDPAADPHPHEELLIVNASEEPTTLSVPYNLCSSLASTSSSETFIGSTHTLSTATSHGHLDSGPWVFNESEYHCTAVFERLRAQREQGRFCDLILSIEGRKFSAHRCVLASASPWFDGKLKVHKTLKEEIEIENCRNLEAFYAVLTYCYTGQITVDKYNAIELLQLADRFAIGKIKTYCSDYLAKHISIKSAFRTSDVAIKNNAHELLKHAVSFIQRNFREIRRRSEMLNMTMTKLRIMFQDRYWSISEELMLSFFSDWVSVNPRERVDHLVELLSYIHWPAVAETFLTDHIDNSRLYQNNEDALFNILHVVLERNNLLSPGSKYHDMYIALNERIFPGGEQDLDELNDSNSFLSIAINSAVKELEQTDVDTDWFLQNEPVSAPVCTSSSTALITASVATSSLQSSSIAHLTAVAQDEAVFREPLPPPPPPTSQHVQYLSTIRSHSNQKDSFDFEIVEQLLNEQNVIVHEDTKCKFSPQQIQSQQSQNPKGCSEVNQQNSSSSLSGSTTSTKRYDPKYRALKLEAEETSSITHLNYSASSSDVQSMNDAIIVNQVEKEDVPNNNDSSVINQQQNVRENNRQSCIYFSPKESSVSSAPSLHYSPENQRGYLTTSNESQHQTYENKSETKCDQSSHCYVQEEGVIDDSYFQGKYSNGSSWIEMSQSNDSSSMTPDYQKVQLRSRSDESSASFNRLLNQKRQSLANNMSKEDHHYSFKCNTLKMKDEALIIKKPTNIDEVNNVVSSEIIVDKSMQIMKEIKQDANKRQKKFEEGRFITNRENRHLSSHEYEKCEKNVQSFNVDVIEKNDLASENKGTISDKHNISSRIKSADCQTKSLKEIVTDVISLSPSTSSQIDKSLPMKESDSLSQIDTCQAADAKEPKSYVQESRDISKLKYLKRKYSILNPKRSFPSEEKNFNENPFSSNKQKRNDFMSHSPAKAATLNDINNLPLGCSPISISQKQHVKKAKLLAEHHRRTQDQTVHESGDEKPSIRAQVASILENANFHISKSKQNTETFANGPEDKSKELIKVENVTDDTSQMDIPQFSCGDCGYTTKLKQRMKAHVRQHINTNHSAETESSNGISNSFFLSQNISKPDEDTQQDSFKTVDMNQLDDASPENAYSRSKSFDKINLDSEKTRRVSGSLNSDLKRSKHEKLKKYLKEKKIRTMTTEMSLKNKKVNASVTEERKRSKFRVKQEYLRRENVVIEPDMRQHPTSLANKKEDNKNVNYKCPVEKTCNFSTKCKSRLTSHVTGTHAGGRFPCQNCDKTFLSQKKLKLHMSFHTEGKPYNCDLCPFKTKYKNHLILHRKFHNGTTLKCDFEGCSYAAVKKSLLDAHRRTHLKEKIFICSKCNRGFVEKSQLTRHVRIHSDELPFQCNLCTFKSKRKDKLKGHYSRVHKIKEIPKVATEKVIFLKTDPYKSTTE